MSKADVCAYRTLSIERSGAVDWLMLDRPERLNCLDWTMVDELADYFWKVARDPEVRAIVLRGAGRAFCAGLDLGDASPEHLDVSDFLRRQRSISQIVMHMRAAPQAIVALVHGPACGGGFALALASDIRLAGRTARMNAAFIRIGLSACDIGVSYLLPRLVGASVAAELMMTGNFIHADRALATGLVSEVVDDDDLSHAAQRYLDAMLGTSPLGIRLTKECLRMSIDAPSLESAIAMEDRNQALCVSHPDFAEGLAAFREKRRPRYAGTP